MKIVVRAARTSREVDRFVRLPFRIYEEDRYWVPPLLSEERKLLSRKIHPFHRHADVEYFIAWRGEKPVGRIAAIVNRHHNDVTGEKAGFFGFFETVENHDTAGTLLRAAEEWLRERSMDVVRGPCNFSTNETCGMLVEGFVSPPSVMMTYNPPYYPRLVENDGYGKAMDLLAFDIPHDGVARERLDRVVGRIKDRSSVNIRPMNLKHFSSELRIVRQIYNAAWEKNWGFVPMTEEEFLFAADGLKAIVDPAFATIAEVNDTPAGFALALPDINQILKKLNGRLFPFGWLKFLSLRKKITAIRIVALGILEQYRHLGIGPLFYQNIIEEGLKRGIRRAEMSWILESNEQMIRPIRMIGGKVSKRYRIYEKKLQATNNP